MEPTNEIRRLRAVLKVFDTEGFTEATKRVAINFHRAKSRHTLDWTIDKSIREELSFIKWELENHLKKQDNYKQGKLF